MQISAALLLVFLTPLQQSPPPLHFHTQEFAPYHFSINQEASGPAVEIIDAICQKIKRSCHHSVLPWRRSINEAKQGNSDGLYMIGMNEQRLSWLHFSLPILQAEYGFFLPVDSFKSIADISQLTDKVVGVYGPSNTSASLEALVVAHNLNTSVELLSDDKELFWMLESGRLDAVYSNKAVGLDFVHKLNLSKIRYGFTDRQLSYYVGFPKQRVNRATVDRFNDAFMELRAAGEFQSLELRFPVELAPLPRSPSPRQKKL